VHSDNVSSVETEVEIFTAKCTACQTPRVSQGPRCRGRDAAGRRNCWLSARKPRTMRHRGELTKGDAAVLRFLAALKFWRPTSGSSQRARRCRRSQPAYVAACRTSTGTCLSTSPTTPTMRSACGLPERIPAVEGCRPGEPRGVSNAAEQSGDRRAASWTAHHLKKSWWTPASTRGNRSQRTPTSAAPSPRRSRSRISLPSH